MPLMFRLLPVTVVPASNFFFFFILFYFLFLNPAVVKTSNLLSMKFSLWLNRKENYVVLCRRNIVAFFFNIWLLYFGKKKYNFNDSKIFYFLFLNPAVVKTSNLLSMKFSLWLNRKENYVVLCRRNIVAFFFNIWLLYFGKKKI